MNNSNYWEGRIANNTWQIYNSLEERNRSLLEMYQEASLNISEELYKVTEKINGGKGVTISDMYKKNNLKNLNKRIENIIKNLAKKIENFGKENMKEGFKDVYSNISIELGNIEFTIPNTRLMEQMLEKPWVSGNFSERIWKNNQVLVMNLNDILTSGLIQGKTIAEISIQLNNAMNVGFNIVHRLIRSETMHYLNESAFKGYVDGGCKEIEVWAAQDERTCKICSAKHGKTYKIKDRPILPLHANCRCTYLPVIDEKVDNELTKNEKYAINNYISSESYKINDKLRNNIVLTGEDEKFINNLDSALNKLPVYQGNLSRSLQFYYDEDLKDFLNNHKVDNILEYSEYISTTKSDTYNTHGQVEIYILNSNKGRDMSKYNEGEQEVIYSRESKFKVKQIEFIENKYHILMEEVY